MTWATLIIEDDAVFAKNIKTYLERNGYEAHTASRVEEGFAQLETFRPDVVLMDFQLPGMNGLDGLKRLRQMDSRMKVIIITGAGNTQLAVDAMKAGAYDYLSKPVALAELKLLMDKAMGDERLEETLAYYQTREANDSGLGKLVGDSKPMQAMKALIRQVLASEREMVDGDPPAVLVMGETGTGKELVARALHFDGMRRERPFVEVNCASIPGNLLEAELFGHERGAFTDAKERRLGLVEAADGGTLFLDEIGELSLETQAKLLKLLEDKTVRRLGSARERKVDVRIVSATNQDLEKMVAGGTFRADLYFRLRIIQVMVPPLRLRQEDIVPLARHFVTQHGARYGRRNLRFSPEAERLLTGYSWPGNVREMRNMLERAVLLAPSEIIEADQLALCPTLGPSAHSGGSADWVLPDQGVNLEDLERDLVMQALDKSRWNVTHAAKLLGLTRDTLRYRLEKYSLKPPAAEPDSHAH
jgi:two-component system response regulator AtoC